MTAVFLCYYQISLLCRVLSEKIQVYPVVYKSGFLMKLLTKITEKLKCLSRNNKTGNVRIT